jgi:hypothetical protein
MAGRSKRLKGKGEAVSWAEENKSSITFHSRCFWLRWNFVFDWFSKTNIINGSNWMELCGGWVRWQSSRVTRLRAWRWCRRWPTNEPWDRENESEEKCFGNDANWYSGCDVSVSGNTFRSRHHNESISARPERFSLALWRPMPKYKSPIDHVIISLAVGLCPWWNLSDQMIASHLNN